MEKNIKLGEGGEGKKKKRKRKGEEKMYGVFRE